MMRRRRRSAYGPCAYFDGQFSSSSSPAGDMDNPAVHRCPYTFPLQSASGHSATLFLRSVNQENPPLPILTLDAHDEGADCNPDLGDHNPEGCLDKPDQCIITFPSKRTLMAAISYIEKNRNNDPIGQMTEDEPGSPLHVARFLSYFCAVYPVSFHPVSVEIWCKPAPRRRNNKKKRQSGSLSDFLFGLLDAFCRLSKNAPLGLGFKRLALNRIDHHSAKLLSKLLDVSSSSLQQLDLFADDELGDDMGTHLSFVTAITLRQMIQRNAHLCRLSLCGGFAVAVTGTIEAAFPFLTHLSIELASDYSAETMIRVVSSNRTVTHLDVVVNLTSSQLTDDFFNKRIFDNAPAMRQLKHLGWSRRGSSSDIEDVLMELCHQLTQFSRAAKRLPELVSLRLDLCLPMMRHIHVCEALQDKDSLHVRIFPQTPPEKLVGAFEDLGHYQAHARVPLRKLTLQVSVEYFLKVMEFDDFCHALCSLGSHSLEFLRFDMPAWDSIDDVVGYEDEMEELFDYRPCHEIVEESGFVDTLLSTVEAMPRLQSLVLFGVWETLYHHFEPSTTRVTLHACHEICRKRAIQFHRLHPIHNVPLSLFPHVFTRLSEQEWYTMSYEILQERHDELILPRNSAGERE